MLNESAGSIAIYSVLTSTSRYKKCRIRMSDLLVLYFLKLIGYVLSLIIYCSPMQVFQFSLFGNLLILSISNLHYKMSLLIIFFITNIASGLDSTTSTWIEVMDVMVSLPTAGFRIFYTFVLHMDVLSQTFSVVAFLLSCSYCVVYLVFASSHARKKIGAQLLIMMVILNPMVAVILIVFRGTTREAITGWFCVAIASICSLCAPIIFFVKKRKEFLSSITIQCFQITSSVCFISYALAEESNCGKKSGHNCHSVWTLNFFMITSLSGLIGAVLQLYVLFHLRCTTQLEQEEMPNV